MFTTRRNLLVGVGALALCAGPARLALAAADTDRRFVLVVLRGGMDGLSALVPYGDAAYAGLRRDLALARPGETDGVQDLNGFFGLHPALAALAPWYRDGSLLPLHAVATPYRERSHFDGQDLLENGTATPHATQDGWLNRTLAGIGGDPQRRLGLAVGQQVPLVLRGPVQVASWAPATLPQAQPQFLDLVRAVYQNDKLLAPALAGGLQAGKMADAALAAGGDEPAMMAGADNAQAQRQRRASVSGLADAAGKMLADPAGPRIAVLELGGWDTHAGQGAAKGRLTQALTLLSDSLTSLRTALGPAWSSTVIAVATEFGRTAAPNGTGGTDHGTATAAFLAGGAVNGGRVLANWPGLAEGKLYQGRDLAPTTDLRAMFKGVLRDHLRLPAAKLDTQIFAKSGDVAPLGGLIRV